MILKFDEFNEKLKINPADINDIDMSNAENYAIENKHKISNIRVAEQKIKNALDKYCTYSSMGKDGYPVNAGELLDEFGYDCDFSIRNKEYSVNYIQYEGDSAIEVDWVSQDEIYDEYSKECLRSMFDEMVKRSGVIDYKILFYCGCRDHYHIGAEPQYTMMYDPSTQTVNIQ